MMQTAPADLYVTSAMESASQGVRIFDTLILFASFAALLPSLLSSIFS